MQLDDLIWTRDLNGFYYLGRVKAAPYAKCISELDIGALVPVELLKIGTCLPGNITSRFTRSGLSPTIERIKDSSVIAYSQALFNSETGSDYYKDYSNYSYDLFEMLPPLDLEELVIDYLQIKYDYYLSKNSVAKLDTTIKVECELFPRKAGTLPPAVLQVKGGTKAFPHMTLLIMFQKEKEFSYSSQISNMEFKLTVLPTSRGGSLLIS